ncbi:S41 family peptidase [Flavobacteriaceae bacterium]|nr:S41 family peptidase [Flavobacteriaceae bacterium]
MKNYTKFYFISILTLLTSCTSNDRDDNELDLGSNPDVEVHDFIWTELNQYYFWQEEVENLADSKKNDALKYKSYLEEIADPSDFFDSLKHPEDRFSWIDDNYVNLENQLAGISSSNGMKFYVTRQCSGCDELVAVVTYVLPGSDAAQKGIERGDLITAVNGEDLDTTNYVNLLYGDSMSYTVGLAEYNTASDSFDDLGESVTLDKVENFQENPIHKNIILDEGGRKVAYLMYNKFLSGFNQELIDTFSEFAAENVTQLVLDLRYNGGGSVLTCVYLASMITGQFTDQIFSKQVWNSKLLAYFEEINNNSNDNDDYELNNYFVSTTTDGVSLPSLNLSNIYVITSGRSASASELLINGLAPHINVVQIGDTTYGKNVASITLYDYVDLNNRVKNPNHTYAMQPIVLKSANSADFSDYGNGLIPDVVLKERSTNLGTLGSTDEPLLALALSQINASRKYSFPKGKILESVADPELESNSNMIVEFPQNKINGLSKN